MSGCIVEGNVERLLLPLMIAKTFPSLKTSCLSILEVGGAFAYRFQQLIEFLGIVTLVITDIDSVRSKDASASADEENDTSDGDICPVDELNAITSNETLKQWLPKLDKISDLLTVTEDKKTQFCANNIGHALIRVTYQTPVVVTWKGKQSTLTGRTLEEAFALENLEWCQDVARKHLRLRVATKSEALSLQDLHAKLFKKITGKGFKKTDFALALMMENPDDWVVPNYMTGGLKWLNEKMTPIQSVPKIAGSQND